ncbi:MAG: BrnT family toxin [Desulfamplus sp.]|nr:BrnT family toxin [Desulfamplus sp.]
MKIEYDPDKNQWNINNRSLSFEQATDLDWNTAQIIEDVRKDYPEPRFVAVASLNGRLHILCFTPVHGGIRVISFRKANTREIKRYEQATIERQ